DTYQWDYRNRLTTVAAMEGSVNETAGQGTDFGWGSNIGNGSNVGPSGQGTWGWGSHTGSGSAVVTYDAESNLGQSITRGDVWHPYWLWDEDLQQFVEDGGYS